MVHREPAPVRRQLHRHAGLRADGLERAPRAALGGELLGAELGVREDLKYSPLDSSPS